MKNNKTGERNFSKTAFWGYSNMKWLTKEEAKVVNKQRDELLNSLSNRVNYIFQGSKVYTGALSPGCLKCVDGTWSCMYIGGRCTANCFYCLRYGKQKERRSLTHEGIEFDNPKNYVDYLAKFNFKGAAFSGGEPLLVLDKLLVYIKAVREKFGQKIYIWMYTNGDLITESVLQKLKEAGLDEIRFNISARNYDLGHAELAVNYIKTVSVEIPAVPADYEIAKKSLAKMQKIGIKHLNIHQLISSESNCGNYIDRGYTFLKQANAPILESEITALKLLKYAVDRKLSLPINYCTCAYRNRTTGRGKRARRAHLVKSDFEELTDALYIRQLSIQDSPRNIRKIAGILSKTASRDNLWLLNDTNTEIFIHSSLLKYVNFANHGLTLRYFNPQLKARRDANETGYEVELNPHVKVYIEKRRIFQYEFTTEKAIGAFRKLFIQKTPQKEVFKYYFERYDTEKKKHSNGLRGEVGILVALKKWEQSESGFPKIL